MKAPPALNDRVSFERRNEHVAGDGAGNFEGEWSPYGPAAVRASIEELRMGAGEDVLRGKLQGRALVNVTLRQSRFTGTLTTDDRLADLRSGAVMNIRHVPAPTREPFITLTCESGVAT